MTTPRTLSFLSVTVLLSVLSVAVPMGTAEAATQGERGWSNPALEDGEDDLDLEDVVAPTDEVVPQTLAIPADAVRITPADDAQAIVASHPAGTTFVFTSGIHREVAIGARTGDTYLGEAGAILDAARPLDLSSFEPHQGNYRLTGVQSDAETAPTEQCTSRWNCTVARPGHESAVFRSELLLAAGERLRHVNSASEVGPGSWHYNASQGIVTVGELPDSLGLSTTQYAFAGWESDDVTIAGLEMRNYASPVQIGAIDALGTSGWTIDGVVVAGSHGYGIRIGEDTTITRSRITDNGHIGIGGHGDDTPVTATYNEIDNNGWLGIATTWETGGIKVLVTDGAVVTHNWVHDNGSKGIWLDGYNRNAEIAYNRVERSGQTGILYEISYAATIHHNLLLDNHVDGETHESYGNLQIVNSRDVDVHHNRMAHGDAQEFTIYDTGLEPGVANINVHSNHITIATDWVEGTYGLKDLRSDKSTPIPGIVFQGNTLEIVQAPQYIFAWDSRLMTADDWTSTHGDTLRTISAQ